jgi:hypothetical protein
MRALHKRVIGNSHMSDQFQISFNSSYVIYLPSKVRNGSADSQDVTIHPFPRTGQTGKISCEQPWPSCPDFYTQLDQPQLPGASFHPTWWNHNRTRTTSRCLSSNSPGWGHSR